MIGRLWNPVPLRSWSWRRLCSTKPTSDEPLLREIYQNNQVVRLVLNTPKKRNVLTMKLMDTLLNELRGIDRIEKVRAVIIAAEGNAFSGGHDLKELKTDGDVQSQKALFAKCTELMTQIQNMHLPVIAEVKGAAAAAGCQLVASCDIAVASDKSTFSVPGLKAGIFCSTPSIPLVRNIPRKVAMDMLLTARALTAQEALSVGLVSRVVPEEETRFESLRVAESICSMSRSVTSLGKAFFHTQVELPITQAYRFGEAVMVENTKMIDCQEGINAFIEKRSPVWSHSDEKKEVKEE